MRNVNAAVCIGMSVVLVLGLAQAPAAQTLESEARRALARQGDPAITHDDVWAILRSRDEVVRDIDRNRELVANGEAFDREVDRVVLAAAAGRLDYENARFEVANRRLEKEIAAERERQRWRWVRTIIRIPVTVVVTVATGNPIIGAAVGSGFSTAVTGGGLDEVVIATATSAAMAGASELASMGIEHVATSVGEQVAAKAADQLAALGVQEAVVDKVAAEVATKVAAKVVRAMDVGLHVIATQVILGQNPGTLSYVLSGVNVATAVGDLLTPVVIDLKAVMELDAAVDQLASGLDELTLDPDDPDAYIAALVERGKVATVLLAANTAVCSGALTDKQVVPDPVCINALASVKNAMDAAKVPPLGDVKSALNADDAAFLEGITRTVKIGKAIKVFVPAASVFGGLPFSKNLGEASAETGVLAITGVLTKDLPTFADVVLSVDRITACTITRNIGWHILGHNLTGKREKYFSALHGVWSTRCAK